MSGHKCPAPGCDKQVPSLMLACRRHWYQIPKPLRDEVWATYADGAGMGSGPHSIAVAEACAYLRRASDDAA